MITAAAVMTVRNEAIHMPYAVEHLIAEGIEVVVLDDGSSDGSLDLIDHRLGKGLIETRRRPGSDEMSLGDLLAWGASVIQDLTHDWVLRVDADEWLMSAAGLGRLVALLDEADRSGATAVNFEEFVFLPLATPPKGDPRRSMLEYYFFEPVKNRLMRAWRRDAGLSNLRHAGHRLEGDSLIVYPKHGILRHYPMVTLAHGRHKYGRRSFPHHETNRGWHRNRVGLVESLDKSVRSGAVVRWLDSWRSAEFDRSAPSRIHFWEMEFGSPEARKSHE